MKMNPATEHNMWFKVEVTKVEPKKPKPESLDLNQRLNSVNLYNLQWMFNWWPNISVFPERIEQNGQLTTFGPDESIMPIANLGLMTPLINELEEIIQPDEFRSINPISSHLQ